MKKWTLFLDRDGVINQHPKQRYVLSWEGFYFVPGVLESIPILNSIFDKIIIVTNQQGIGKGMMTVPQLEDIHRKMIDCIEAFGGRIDHICYCQDLATNPGHQRKPRPGMALEAQQLFPSIDFQTSVMIGDQKSDMEFGKNLGMKCIHIQNNESHHPLVNRSLYDLAFETLYDCSIHLKKNYEQVLQP